MRTMVGLLGRKAAFSSMGVIPAELTHCTGLFCAKQGTLRAYPEPNQVVAPKPSTGDATYRWQNDPVIYHFCPVCGCGMYKDSPATQPHGTRDKTTRRIGLNARLFDEVDATLTSVAVTDGNNPW